MVFEGIVSSLLNKYLGEFVENLDSSQLNISIFSGCVELNNLRLKTTALDNFGLPFKIKNGLLGKLFLNIPWQSLYTNATEVVIENLFINAYLDTDISADKHEILKQKLKMTTLENMESMFSIKLLSAVSTKIEDPKKSTEQSQQSYVEKIGALIIRNLLITLKNINIIFEQNVTDELFKPFYYGINLKSLTALTTNKHYQPCFSSEITPLIYKLIKLDCTSIYWLPEKCKFDYDNINETIEKLSKVDYILKLDDIYLKACLNTDPSHNLKIPNLGIILNLQAVAMTFNVEMFTSTINMINHYTNTKLKILYSQYKSIQPSIITKAKANWEYAINVILNQYVRPKSRTWSWAYIKNYRQQAKDYQKLYMKLLRKENGVIPQMLESYEKSLNLMTLFLCRHTARLAVKKDNNFDDTTKIEKQQTTSSSWFSRIFGSRTQKATASMPSNIECSMEAYLGLTEEEQKEQLNQLLNVVGHVIVDQSKLPTDHIKLTLSVVLDEFEWIIKKNRIDSLLVFKLKTFSSNFSVFSHKSGSMSLSATVYDMNISALRKCGFQFDFFKIIESSQDNATTNNNDNNKNNNNNNHDDDNDNDVENVKSPLVNMIYSAYSPHSPEIDHKFNMVTKKSQINVDILFLSECVDIVNSLPTIDQWETFAIKNNNNANSHQNNSDNDIIWGNSGEKLDLSVDACVSAIHICEDFVVVKNDVIVLNLGYVCLVTKPSETIMKYDKFVDDINLMSHRKSMQHFDFNLTNVSIRINKNATNYMKQQDVSPWYMDNKLLANDAHHTNNYILTPFSIDSEISTAFGAYNDQNAQLVVLSLVSETCVMMSTLKIVSICKLVDSILSILPKIGKIQSSQSLEDKLEIFDVNNGNIYNNSNLDDFLNLQSPSLTNSIITTSTAPTIASSRSEISLDSKKSLTSNRRAIQLHLVAPIIKLLFIFEDYHNRINDITFTFSENSLEFIGQTIDYSFNLITKKTTFEHNCSNKSNIIFNVDDGLTLTYRMCMLPSILQQASNNRDLSPKQIDKAKLIYEEFYDSVEHAVDIKWGTLSFVCCYEIIQAIRGAFKKLTKSITKEFSDRKLAAQNVPDLSSVVLQVSDMISTDKTGRDKLIDFSKKYIIINIHVDSVSLIFTHSQREIAHIIFKEWFGDVCFYSNHDVNINCILDDLSVWDLGFEQTKFDKIVSVEGGKLFNLKLYIDNHKLQHSIPPAAVVDLKIAQLTFVFIYRFINNIIEWSNCMVQKQQLIIATGQAISDFTTIAKKQVTVKHTLVQFNIDIGAPIFVIPFKSNKPCVVIADFGHVYIHNTFINDTVDSSAVSRDKYIIDLEHINISRAIYGDILNTKQNILDPLDISLTLTRYLSEESPKISISIVNELINFSLSPQDFLALVRLFLDNFSESSMLSDSVLSSPTDVTNHGNHGNLIVEDYFQPLMISQKQNNDLSSRSRNDLFVVLIEINISNMYVTLFDVGDADDTKSYSENVIRRTDGSMFARLNTLNFHFKAEYNINGDLSVDIELPRFTVLDMRPSTTELRRRVIFFDLNEKPESEESISQVFVNYSQNQIGTSSVALAVNDVTLFLNASYLKSLYDSYIVPLLQVRAETIKKELNFDFKGSPSDVIDTIVNVGNDDIGDYDELTASPDETSGTLDITYQNPACSHQDRFSCSVDVKSSRLIACATDTTEHALFAQMVGNLSYEFVNLKTSMFAKIAALSLDCARFSGCWRSDTKYCQAVRMKNSFFSITYQGDAILDAVIDIYSLLADIAPPTLMAIFSIKDILLPHIEEDITNNSVKSLSAESSGIQQSPVDKPIGTKSSNFSINNVEFVQLWSAQPIDRTCWYLRDISPSELVIGTAAWVRLSDTSYHKLILFKIVLNMLHLQSVDTITSIIYPKEDTLAVVPDLALQKPLKITNVSVGNIVFVDNMESNNGRDTRSLGEITQVQLLNNKLLKIQVFLYEKDTRVWLSQNQIYIIPKQFVRSYPGVYSHVFVRCCDGRYRMGSIRSVSQQNIHFSVTDERFQKSYAFLTDTAAWSYPWRSVSSVVISENAKVIQSFVYSVVLALNYSFEGPTVGEPVFVISVQNYPIARVRYIISNKIKNINLSECILLDKQRGFKFGLGSRWLVMGDKDHFYEYILNKKTKQMLSFIQDSHDKAKLFNLYQKSFFLIDSEISDETLDYDNDVYVLENPETGVYIRGRVVKKSYWLNIPEYKVKLSDGRYIIRCPIQHIRQRSNRFSNRSNNQSYSTGQYSVTNFENTQVEKVPKVSIKISTMNFVIEGLINQKIVPLLHLGASAYGSIFNINTKNIMLQLKVSVVAYYFNNKCGEWEPLIERVENDGVLFPWSCQLEYKTSTDMLISNSLETVIDNQTIKNDKITSDSHPHGDYLTDTCVQPDKIPHVNENNVYETCLILKSTRRLEFTITNKTIETLKIANYIFSADNIMKNEYSFLRNDYIIINSLGVSVTIIPNSFFTTGSQSHIFSDTLELYPMHPFMFDQKLSDNIIPQLSIYIPGFRPLESVSIISNKSFQLMLHPTNDFADKQSNQHPLTTSSRIFPSIILDIKSEKGSKIINLRTILRIHNMLNHSLEVELFPNKNQMNHAPEDYNGCKLKLNSGSSNSCSLNQLSNNSYLTFFPAFSYNKVRISLQKLVDHYKNIISCLAMTFEEHNNFYIMLKLDQDDEPRVTRGVIRIDKTPIRPLVLYVLPPIIVHNHVPYMIVLSFISDFSFPITVCDDSSIYNIDLNKNDQILYVKVCGYLSENWNGKISLSNSNRKKSSIIEFIKEPQGGSNKQKSNPPLFNKPAGRNNLYLIFDIKFPSNMVINIYSPVFIMNNCLVPINLKISRMAESWVYEVPSNTLFLLKYQGKDYKGCIRFGNSKWSKNFSLGAVGNRATLTCADKTGSIEYKVSMKITTADYYATKWIKFKPFYLLENNLDVAIDIIHSGNQSIHLESNTTNFFWPTEKFPMELKIGFNNEIVYTFTPQPDEAIVVKLIDKKINKYDTIVVNTSQQDYSTKIIFNNYFEGCAPVLLVNACVHNNLPVYFKQQRAVKAYPLLSGCRIFYTWENFKNPLEMLCSFNSDFNNAVEINVKRSVYAQVQDGNFPIYVATFLDGLQRVCLFSDDLRVIWRAVQESSSDSTITVIVELEGLGLSVVNLDTNVEVFYLSIQSNIPYWQYLKLLPDEKLDQGEEWALLGTQTSHLIEYYYGYYEQTISAFDTDDITARRQNSGEFIKSSSSETKHDSNNDTLLPVQPNNEDLSKGLIALSNNKRINFNEMYILDGHNKRRNIRRIKYSGLRTCVVLSDVLDVKAIDLKIFHLQIDNPSISSNFPVVIAPTPAKESVDFNKSIQQHVIKFVMELRPPRIFGDRRIIHVDNCILLVQEINLSIDLGLVSKVSHFLTVVTENSEKEGEIGNKRNFDSILGESQQIERKRSLLCATSTSMGKVNSTRHDEATLRYSQTYFIFDFLHLSPLKIIVAFSNTTTIDPREKNFNESSFIVQTILSHVPFVDVCDIALRLSCFELTSSNKLVSFSELQKQIIEHYTFQTLRQAFVLVLGLDVIGNPFNFVTELASGTKNLFYEPYMGSIQGADQFAKGLSIGLRSFASGTFGNAAGVLSKVTNSLGTGLAILSFDSQHQLSRRSNKRIKPQNIQEGISQGGKGFVRGVVSGISGIVIKPIEGAISEGAEGFFKGIGKGIAGVFVKPVGGVIDLASSTLAGIKGEIKGSSIVRVYRFERPFYASGVLRNYLKTDADGYNLYQRMLKSNPGEYGGFVKCINLPALHILLTEWFLLTIELDNILDSCTIIKAYDIYHISDITCVKRSIRFKYLVKKTTSPIEFNFKSEEQARVFYNTLLVVLSWL